MKLNIQVWAGKHKHLCRHLIPSLCGTRNDILGILIPLSRVALVFNIFGRKVLFKKNAQVIVPLFSLFLDHREQNIQAAVELLSGPENACEIIS